MMPYIFVYTRTAVRTINGTVASTYILHPVDDENLPTFLPAQPILSSGMFCTEYSRCSDTIVQTVRFFDIISSSLSRKFTSHAEYHRNSQSQIKGLSARETNKAREMKLMKAHEMNLYWNLLKA